MLFLAFILFLVGATIIYEVETSFRKKRAQLNQQAAEMKQSMSRPEDITYKALSPWGKLYMRDRVHPTLKGTPWEFDGKRYNHSTNPNEFDVHGRPQLATDCFIRDGEVVFIYRIY